MSYRLRTQRLELRPLVEDDAPFILELLNDPDFIRQIADRGVRDLDGARRYLREGPLASYARHGHGLLMVETQPGGEPIGICGLVRRDALPHVDLGYALLPAWRGHGYACEAGAAVLAHAWEVLGLETVLAIVAPGNRTSTNVLERLGFAPSGLVRMPGEDKDLELHAARHVHTGYTSAQ